MKKYMKTIIVLALIIGSFGTYYVYSISAQSANPEIAIETVSGDESMLDRILIQGGYNSGFNYMSFVLDESGATFQNDLNFLERMDGIYQTTKKRLEKEYKSFMRGKEVYHDNIYEDDDHLVVVSEDLYRSVNQDYKLTASFLDKETEEEFNTEVSFPVSSYDYMRILDVQMNDGLIQIFTQAWANGMERSYPEVHVLEINPTNEEMIGHRVILSGDGEEIEEGANVDLTILGDSVSWVANEFVVFRQQTHQWNENVDYPEEGPAGLYAYDLAARDLKKLEIPEPFGNRTVDAFDGTNLYFYEESGNQLNMKVYNLHEEQFVEDLTLETGGEPFYPTLMFDGNLYGIQRIDEEFHLFVFDQADGSKMYEGKIEVEDDVEIEDLYFDGIVVK